MPEVLDAVNLPTAGEVRAAHAEEMRASTRTTGLAGGALILVALPLWGVYDRIVEPELAAELLTVRLLLLIPIFVGWLALWHRSFGERHAEVLAVAVCAIPQFFVAWMLPNVDHAFAGYLLGFTLVVYGCAFLLVGRIWITVALVAITWASATVSYVAQRSLVDSFEVSTTIFYLGTASLLAFIGRYYRIQIERRELAARLALEREQERTLVLVAELDRLSREDSLTGVANRRAWDEALARACAEADRAGRQLSVLLLDIDRFKAINDQHGHRRGDQVLQEVAGCLASRSRDSDLLARVGGDEFAVLCPDTGPEDTGRLAEDLARLVGAMPGELSVSVGAAVRWPGADPDALMGLADRRLYDAKRNRPEMVATAP
jgi:diguanylate cyclase (GGDEF)-like protein